MGVLHTKQVLPVSAADQLSANQSDRLHEPQRIAGFHNAWPEFVLSHLPVVGDPSHGTGRRDMVAPMAKAALAAGADALLMEIHPNADKAVSDAAQTLYLEQFEKLMGELRLIATAIGRTL